MNVAEALDRVRGGGVLTRDASRALFAAVLADPGDEELLGDLLTALAARGETAAEILGAAEAMRGAMVPFHAASAADAVDTCGTGGDGLGSFNLSTAAALVVAACGVPVVKHGNRAASSRCGSADLLEAAGVRLALTPEAAAEVLERCGFVFLFAPAFHPALGRLAPLRRRLGVRTIFNFLGPLCNPAGVRRQLLGVSAADRLDDYAAVLAELGVSAAAAVHGAGGADELTLEGPAEVRWVLPGGVTAERLDAGALGLDAAPNAALRGCDAATNLALLRSVLDGEPGPLRDAVLLNAAAALAVAGCGTTPPGSDRIASELQRAGEAVDSGRAAAVLEELVAATREVAAGGSAR